MVKSSSEDRRTRKAIGDGSLNVSSTLGVSKKTGSGNIKVDEGMEKRKKMIGSGGSSASSGYDKSWRGKEEHTWLDYKSNPIVTGIAIVGASFLAGITRGYFMKNDPELANSATYMFMPGVPILGGLAGLVQMTSTGDRLDTADVITYGGPGLIGGAGIALVSEKIGEFLAYTFT